jgi:prepilin-type processing-associated H-X9-DG protein
LTRKHFINSFLECVRKEFVMPVRLSAFRRFFGHVVAIVIAAVPLVLPEQAQAVPSITSITPNTGSFAGGYTVVIAASGIGALGLVDTAPTVSFGGTAATSISRQVVPASANLNAPYTQITCTVPAHAAGAVSVTVTYASNTSGSLTFTYTVSAPTVSHLSVSTGPVGGNTNVTITGTNFVAGGTTVHFGTVAATTNLLVSSTTSLSVNSPAISTGAGVVDVTVTNTVGTSATSTADRFTYTPTLTNVVPDSGGTGGGGSGFGCRITLTGKGFTGASAVNFFNTSNNFAPTVPSLTGTITTLTTSATVTGVGTSFTTQLSTGILIYSGATLLGTVQSVVNDTSLTLTGNAAAAVTAAAFSGTNILVASDTSMSVAAPVSTLAFAASAGTSSSQLVFVSVTAGPGASTGASGQLAGTSGSTPTGTATLGTNGYSYVTPTITSGTAGFSPGSTATNPVPAGGGTVTINGSGFTGINTNPSSGSVTFAGVNATGITFISDAQIVVTVAGSASTVTAGAIKITVGLSSVTSSNILYMTGAGSSPTVAVTPTGTSTNVSPITFTLTFSQSVTGLAATGLTVTNGTLGTLSGSGTTYAIPVTPSASGVTVTLQVNANAAGGNTVSNTASVSYSNTAPTVAVTPTGTSTTSSPIAFTMTFSESVTGLTTAGLTVGNGTLGTLAGSGTSWTIPVTPTAAGAVTLQVNASAAQDVFGNYNTVSGTASVNYSVAPVLTSYSVNGAAAVTTGATIGVGGGYTVTINGSGFTGISTTTLSNVQFAGTNALQITFVNDGQITAISPQFTTTHSSTNIKVTVGSNSTTSSNGTLVVSGPVFSPTTQANTVGCGGGYSVTITGNYFTGFTAGGNTAVNPAILFDGYGPATIVSATDTSLSVTTQVIPTNTSANISVTTNTVSANFSGFTSNIPTVTSVSPTTLLLAGGPVVITGNYLLGATAVTFGGTNATSFTVNSATQITATAPPMPAGAQAIAITAGVASGSTGVSVTYLGPPTVTGLNPSSGSVAGGTSVALTGTNFTGATNVYFGTTAATFTFNSATSITATAPADTVGPFNVTVVSPQGTSAAASANLFTYIPVVTSLSPSTGGTGGGLSVTINGQGFTGVTAVSFGGQPATAVNFVSDTQITVTNPPSTLSATYATTQAVAVTVTAQGYTSSSTQTAGQNVFTYGTPSITGLAVSDPGGIWTQTGGTAGAGGGYKVTITGSGFTGINTSVLSNVQFNGVSATSITFVSDTQITAVTAPAAVCYGADVTVTVGQSTAIDAGSFFISAPTISLITPGSTENTSGPNQALTVGGGASVVITGKYFSGINTNALSSVTFAGVNATNISFNSDIQITATAPAVPNQVSGGTLQVTVGSATGSYYSLNMLGPNTTSVSPGTVSVGGGTTVVLTGYFYTGATQVSFGGTPAASFVVNSPTQITAVAPAHAAANNQDVIVYTNGVTGSNDVNNFVFSGPTILSVTPNTNIPNAGGTLVTINGQYFTGINTNALSSVTFAGANAASITFVSDTQLTAVTPAHTGESGGAVAVTVGSSTGTYSPFNYLVPTVTSVIPSIGAIGGGTLVSIVGTDLTGATQVLFGTSPASSFTVNSATSISAVAPNSPTNAAGTFDVTVVVPGAGTSTANTADQYTYAGPIITSASPNPVGAGAAGTVVTINGQYFTGINTGTLSSVTFGGVNAASITFVSDSLLQATPTFPGSGSGITVNVGLTSGSYAGWNFAAPAVTNVSPSSVDIGGGTPVTITGQYFTGINTNALSSVTFAGVNAASITFVSDTQLKAVTAASKAKTGPVAVTVGSMSGSYSPFTYAGDVVNLISPNSGPISGGTTVAISGVGFTTATAVSFGSTPATSFTINSDTSITAVSPAGAAGAVNVIVSTGGLASTFTSEDLFTFFLPFNYAWTTWSTLNWSTPTSATISWNSQTIPVAVSVNNRFFSWYAAPTQYSVNPANGSLSGTAWNPTPVSVNIAGSGGMDGPFAGIDPTSNNGSILSGDWKDFATGQLSYYGSYSNSTAWNNPVFWSYYNAAFPGATYSITATTTNVTVNTGYQYYLTADGLPNSPLGRTSYVGNSGMFFFKDDPNNPTNSAYANGPFFADSRVPVNEISDGSSNTIMFGECLGGPDNALPTYQLTWMGTGAMPSYWDCQTPSQYFMFSSMHPGVVNFAFCDGSVRPITKVTAPVPPDVMGASASQTTGGGTSNVQPPRASNPATARWTAFQLLAGINDNRTPDFLQLGLTP